MHCWCKTLGVHIFEKKNSIKHYYINDFQRQLYQAEIASKDGFSDSVPLEIDF